MTNKAYNQKILADSRAAAESAHLDLDVIDKALSNLQTDDSAFQLWRSIDEEIGKAADSNLATLAAFRDLFVEELVRAERSRLEAEIEASSKAGWNSLITTLAEATGLFRHAYGRRLCELRVAPAELQQPLEYLKHSFEMMDQSRWAETYEPIQHLASFDFVPPITRARLYAILGQIQQFHLQRNTAAKQWLDSAEQLAPEDGRVLAAIADYWLGEKNVEQLKLYSNRAIQLTPLLANAYTTMGDYYESDGNLVEAEAWFRKAVNFASGDGFGYVKLLKLYGRPELLSKHANDFEPLKRRLRAIAPEYAYQLYIDWGYIYQQNGKLDQALEQYEDARDLNESRPTAYVMIGQIYEKQADDPKKISASARDAYLQSVAKAPSCPDGYWALAWLYEQAEDWREALKWYERMPLRLPELTGLTQAKAAEMYANLGEKAKAEEILLTELRKDNKNETAKNILHSLADDYYKIDNQREKAIRILDQISDILREPYLGFYHNRLGNIHYYFSEYQLAAEEYELATQASSNAVFHRNLAVANQELKKYAKAADQLDQAFKIDGDTKALNREMALLRSAEANDLFEAADYRGAVKKYSEALVFDSNNDEIHARLAGVWERFVEPGRRLDALDRALGEFQVANKLKPAEKYASNIQRLISAKEFVKSFGERSVEKVLAVTPIVVGVAFNLVELIASRDGEILSDELATQLKAMRTRILNDFGVRLPGIRFRDDLSLSDGSYVILLKEIPLVMGTIDTTQRFVPGNTSELRKLKSEPVATLDESTGVEGVWVGVDDLRSVAEADLKAWSAIEYPVRHLEVVLRNNLKHFVGHQEVAQLLDDVFENLTLELRAAPGVLTSFTSVCQGLVAEKVPLKPLDEIWRSFLGASRGDTNLQNIVEEIRSLPAVRSQLPGNAGTYSILRLGPAFETAIRDAIYESGAHRVLALEPEPCQALISSFRNSVSKDAAQLAVVEDARLRPFVRSLIELGFPGIPVMSRRELDSAEAYESSPAVEMTDPIPAQTPHFRRPNKSFAATFLVPALADKASTDRPGISVVVQKSDADSQEFREMLNLMQDGLFDELGVILPDIRLEVDSTLKPEEFRFRINGGNLPFEKGLHPNEILVNEAASRLKLFGIEGRDAVNPANGNPATVVVNEAAVNATCKEAGLTTWGPAGFIVLHLSSVIRKQASSFQNLQSTQFSLDALRTMFPELATNAVNRFSVEQIGQVLKNMLEEEISIRDLRGILESMLSVNGVIDVDEDRFITFIPPAENLCSPVTGATTIANLSADDYSAFVRTKMKRYISHKYTRGQNTLVVYLLDRGLAARINRSGEEPFTEDEIAELKSVIRAEVGDAQNPVILTTLGVRPVLKKMLESDLPKIAVLAFQELSPELNIQPIAWIRWERASTQTS